MIGSLCFWLIRGMGKWTFEHRVCWARSLSGMLPSANQQAAYGQRPIGINVL